MFWLELVKSVMMDFNAIDETFLERKFLLITNIIYSKSVLFFNWGAHCIVHGDAKMISIQLFQSLYPRLHQMPAPPLGTENGIPLFYRFVKKFSLYFLSLGMCAFNPASWNFHFIQLHLYCGSMRYFGKCILLVKASVYIPSTIPPFQCCRFFFSPTLIPSSFR